MNVAFPAIFLFLLLSPGIVFHRHYQPREVRAADMSPFGTTVVTVAIASLVFNIVTMAAATHFCHYEFRLGQIVRLLVDGRLANNDPDLATLFHRLDQHPTEPLWFFIVSNVLAGATAALWRVLVVWLRLDHPSFPFYTRLRPPAPWHYLFSGVDVVDFTPDAVVVAALVPLKESTYVFTGLLRDYELTDKGELDRIVISQAARRRLEDDRKTDNGTSRLSPENFDRFYWIEGDTLVLRASEFTTLNIKFLVLEPLNEASQEKNLHASAQRDQNA
ncbi:hypothetical protein [Burkholderia pyrrocinia]|uniref:hypothetical protein n=1 Tax=Burkholderia pyrrocinia TaxID=60550 RepID=UPI00158AFF49|nr:hypothetical protein [Burkholderia pyrrocinia]